MWEVLFYYVSMAVFLYLSYVILFCSYEEKYENYYKAERVKYPLFFYILAVIIALVPFVNTIGIVALIRYMCNMVDEGIEYKTFLFKKR